MASPTADIQANLIISPASAGRDYVASIVEKENIHTHTFAELSIINDIYQGDLRLYKNFFQPVMKLTRKVRIGATVKREYNFPKTPSQRLMESKQLSHKARTELEAIYLSLNPA